MIVSTKWLIIKSSRCGDRTTTNSENISKKALLRQDLCWKRRVFFNAFSRKLKASWDYRIIIAISSILAPTDRFHKTRPTPPVIYRLTRTLTQSKAPSTPGGRINSQRSGRGTLETWNQMIFTREPHAPHPTTLTNKTLRQMIVNDIHGESA